MAGRKRFDVRALYIDVLMITSFVAAFQEDGAYRFRHLLLAEGWLLHRRSRQRRAGGLLLSYPTSPRMLGNISSFRELEWRGRYPTLRMGCSMSYNPQANRRLRSARLRGSPG
jgi:hypothetical protein